MTFKMDDEKYYIITMVHFNAEQCQFQPGKLFLDWFIWEDVDTAYAGPDPLTEKMYKCNVSWGSKLLYTSIKLEVPISRRNDYTTFITIPARCTVRELLTLIHTFYASSVTLKDLIDLDDDTDYFKNAIDRLNKGENVTWLDLVGSKMYFGEFGEYRRHPFSCSGLVRLEGFQQIGDGVFYMQLGS